MDSGFKMLMKGCIAMDSLESRVTDLEIQISHQIKLLDELNSIIINQQKKLEEFSKFRKLLMQELKNSDSFSGAESPSTPETRPPHY